VTSIVLIDDTPEKGALCDNENIVIVPLWVGPLLGDPPLCDSLLPWLRDLLSSSMSIVNFFSNKRYGLFLVPLVEFSQEIKKYDKVIAGGWKRS
jgi:hypothetical protein